MQVIARKRVSALHVTLDELQDAYDSQLHYQYTGEVIKYLAGEKSSAYFRLRVAGLTWGELHVFNRELATRIAAMTTAEQESFHQLLILACDQNEVEEIQIKIKWSKAGATRTLLVNRWSQGIGNGYFDIRLM